VTQRVQNIRSLIARLDWRFSAWADEFTELYFKALSCPYAEVRALVSTILNSLDQLRVCPFLRKCLTDSSIPRTLQPRL
jgi:proteasome activator subunit 4